MKSENDKELASMIMDMETKHGKISVRICLC